MSELFDFAAAMAREQAANTRYETTHRRMLESFAAGRAKRLAEVTFAESCTDAMTQADINAEELALFNRAEARAINNGFN